jgi:hypothetical protein
MDTREPLTAEHNKCFSELIQGAIKHRKFGNFRQVLYVAPNVGDFSNGTDARSVNRQKNTCTLLREYGSRRDSITRARSMCAELYFEVHSHGNTMHGVATRQNGKSATDHHRTDTLIKEASMNAGRSDEACSGTHTHHCCCTLNFHSSSERETQNTHMPQATLYITIQSAQDQPNTSRGCCERCIILPQLPSSSLVPDLLLSNSVSSTPGLFRPLFAVKI